MHDEDDDSGGGDHVGRPCMVIIELLKYVKSRNSALTQCDTVP